MIIKQLSDSALDALLDLIRECVVADENTAPGSPKPYGVKAHTDWRKQADDFEAELRERNIEFKPIIWS